MNTYKKLYINGEWVSPENNATFPCIDPFDESHITDVAAASVADAEKAVQAAREAFDNGSWSELSGKEPVGVAVASSNNSIFGLEGAVMSKNTGRCNRVARDLKAGIVMIVC